MQIDCKLLSCILKNLLGEVIVEAELFKFSVLRILLASTILLRLLLNLVPSAIYFMPECNAFVNPHFILDLVLIVASSCLLVGFSTQLSLAILIVGLPLFDSFCGMLTLGTTILGGLLVLLFFVGPGTHLSFDSIIRRKHPNSILAYTIALQHSTLWPVTKTRLRIYLLLTFLQYGLTNLGAVLFHIQDPYWLHGSTVGIAFTSSYLCKQFELFRTIEKTAPFFLITFSQLSGLIQTLYQFGMIPLAVLSRRSRSLIVFWGYCFFFMSFFFLQLSYLPFIESILWLAIFYRMPKRFLPKELAVRSKGKNLPILFSMQVAAFVCLSMLYVCTFSGIKDCKGVRAIYNLSTLLQPVMFSLGFCCPNVFNSSDLKLSNRWFCLFRTDDIHSIVPLNHLNGQRLWYHNFDLIYFVPSLRWRRLAIDENYPLSDDSKSLIKRIALFDKNLTRNSCTTYKVKIYETEQSLPEKPAQERYDPKLKYEFDISL